MATEIEKLIQLTQAQTAILTTISRQLERMAQASAPASPNYRRRLSEYPQFDWSEIGATVTATDDQGVSEVEWNLHRFTRRAGSGKFGKAIWFSRPTGKDGDETNYARLITFKDGDAEPVPGDVVQQSQVTPRPQLVKSDPASGTPKDAIKPLDIYAPADAKGAQSVPAKDREYYDNIKPNQPEKQIDPLQQEAAQVADAPSFYSLVNKVLKGRRDLHTIVSRIVNTPDTTWTEKAQALVMA